MPNDMENFIEYHIMGSVSQIRMKSDCLPTKFDCQPDTTQPTIPTTVETQRKSLIEECIKDQNQVLVIQKFDEDYEVPIEYSDNVAEEFSDALVQMEAVYVDLPTWEDGVAEAGAGSYQECRAQQEAALQNNSAPRAPATQADPLASPPKPYSCETCTQQFQRLSHLKEHVLTHSDERPFRCQTCHQCFQLYNDLKVHQCTHSSEKPYACKTGNKNVADIATLQSHKRTHAGDKPYSCNMCDKTFTHSHHLKMHCQKHRGIQRDLKVNTFYKWCAVPLCASNSKDTPEKLFIHIPRSGDSRELWLRFAGRDPATVAPRSTLYFCEDHFDMPKDMLNYTQYRVMGSVARVMMRAGCVPTKVVRHTDAQATEVPTTPPFAGMEQTDCTLNTFVAEDQSANTGCIEDESVVKVEVKGEVGELYAGHEVRGELVLGPVGGRVNDLSGGVKREPVWETGEWAPEFTNTCVAVKTEPTEEGPERGEHTPPATEPPRPRVYTCSTCSRHFTRVSQYNEHLRVHTGERPYACDMCNKRFKQLSTMKVHRRIHTGERPFSCNICHRTFLRLKSLQNHERTHTGEKPYSCEICKLRFAQLEYLKVHVIRMHSGERPYACGRCGNRYGTAKDLKKHERRHDREKTHKCEICKKEFTTIVGLNNHERLIHSKSKKPKDNSITLHWHRMAAKDNKTRRRFLD